MAGAEALAANLPPLAAAIGQAWVEELVHTLRGEERDVAGAWPGTLSEARMRVRTALHTKLDLADLEQLARIVNLTAKRGWQDVCVTDPE